MKLNSITHIQRLTLCLFLFSMLSCYKVDFEDYFHPDKTPKYCSIKKILSYNEYNIDTLVWTFNYNQWGDPHTVRLSNVSTGRPEFQFFYDHHHRLTDFLGSYEGNRSFEFWHKYVYEGKKIVRDTVFIFGLIINGKPVVDPMSLHLTQVHSLEYDNYDRVIKNTIVYPYYSNVPVKVEEFTYTASGNLGRYKLTIPEFSYTQTDTTYTNYDNKVNLHRTHKIWMFIDRNYSMNNPAPAISYNKYGLPNAFRSSALLADYDFIHVERNIADSDIQYDCK